MILWGYTLYGVTICAILSVGMTNIESEIMECSSLSLQYSHHSPFIITQLGRDDQKLESFTYPNCYLPSLMVLVSSIMQDLMPVIKS